MSLTRHAVREKAFQTLFALNFNSEVDRETQIYQVLEFGLEEDAQPEVEIPAYLDLLVSGVLLNQKGLDEAIQPYLKQWTLDRLSRTDLILLRLAVFEIKYVDDVPAKVAVNEALELAKNYSDDKSRKFINAVLSQFIEKE